MKKLIIAMVIITSVGVATSKVAKVVNPNYIEYSDNTGYYSEKEIFKGDKILVPFVKIMDIFGGVK
ncbi:MAG: hypothetical protein RSB54_02785 [Bacilli bacterium]